MRTPCFMALIQESRVLRYSPAEIQSPQHTQPPPPPCHSKNNVTLYKEMILQDIELIAEQSTKFLASFFREGFVDSRTSKEPIVETSSNLACY